MQNHNASKTSNTICIHKNPRCVFCFIFVCKVKRGWCRGISKSNSRSKAIPCVVVQKSLAMKDMQMARLKKRQRLPMLKRAPAKQTSQSLKNSCSPVSAANPHKQETTSHQIRMRRSNGNTMLRRRNQLSQPLNFWGGIEDAF